ncbi:hypothetical protein ACFSTH_09345 [Paenibacillus yanchengensis]|uniref:Uncharacterized protein n=1 Tax=Paenibacillus yanchengensis TaxID=2035833 RepID=A0ABW4YGL0_9BACL
MYKWNGAYTLVTEDKAVVSGEWKVQKDNDGNIVVEKFAIQLTYLPIYR